MIADMAANVWDPRGKKGTSINITGPTIKVLVGVDEREYFVHEKLIRAQSPFFEAALSKDWQEGVERCVKLPEDAANVFEAYTLWLYTNRIYCSMQNTLSEKREDYALFAKLYVLGEKPLDRQFQNKVIDAFVTAMRAALSKPTVKAYKLLGAFVEIVYEGCPAGSPLRKFAVDFTVAKGSARWVESLGKVKLPEDFIFELSIASLKRCSLSAEVKKEYEETDFGSPCLYHHRGENEKCGNEVE